MVAKSYQNNKILSEPFMENGRMYVFIETKSNPKKQVRWYDEKEYGKLYGKTPTSPKPAPVAIKRSFGPVKEVLGFGKGHIYIFTNVLDEYEDFFNRSPARYHRLFGWYVFEESEMPQLPAGVEMKPLYWDAVGGDDGYLRSDPEVKAAVDEILYPPSDSKFQGKLDERIERTVTILGAKKIEGQYGTSTFYLFEDAEGNRYTWTTSSREWPIGASKRIKGTVKGHAKARNEERTILTRCTEV